MIGLALAVRNSRLAAVVSAIDAGEQAGRLRIYQGTRPATAAAANPSDRLADLALASPCGAVDGGVLTFSVVADQPALAGGTPTWCRITDSDHNPVLDGDVGAQGSGALVEIDDTTLYAGGLVILLSATLTEGNP